MTNNFFCHGLDFHIHLKQAAEDFFKTFRHVLPGTLWVWRKSARAGCPPRPAGSARRPAGRTSSRTSSACPAPSCRSARFCKEIVRFVFVPFSFSLCLYLSLSLSLPPSLPRTYLNASRRCHEKEYYFRCLPFSISISKLSLLFFLFLFFFPVLQSSYSFFKSTL